MKRTLVLVALAAVAVLLLATTVVAPASHYYGPANNLNHICHAASIGGVCGGVAPPPDMDFGKPDESAGGGPI